MSKVFCGNEMDKMPGWAFRIMSFMFNFTDLFNSPDKKLTSFNIKKGDIIVDYGCGTGRYLKEASELVGSSGIVYAVDIHELAIKSAFGQIKKYDLKNIKPVQTDGNTTDIPSHSIDLIFALDMFHMVRNTFVFFKELHRMSKPEGTLIIEDGHQPRSLSREKILKSELWEIIEENKAFLTCRPKNLDK
jgi:ubiquinone/menaquinone biosynthesis C-methylase UbiE